MSAPSSAASDFSTTDSILPACDTPGSASPNPIVEQSLDSASPELTPMTTCERSQEQLALMSSPAGSPVKASRVPVLGRASVIPRLHFGARCSESFASYDRATSSWRTSQTSLLSTEASSLARYSEAWPRAGTTRNGIASRLLPLALRTDAIESSSPLLPTPHGFPKTGQRRNPGPTGNELGRAITRLLPTPTKMDGVGSRGHKLDGTPYTETSGTTLTDAAYELAGVHTNPQYDAGKGSSADLSLSPSFVEWLMGTPAGWSDPDCPLSATEFSSRPAGSSEVA